MDVMPSFSSALLDLKGDLSEVELICIYGIADGSAYRHLRYWLRKNPNHRVVFIEEDEGHFLKMKEGGMASDPQVRLLFYSPGCEELFKEIAWEFVFLKIGFYARSRDLEEKGGKISEVFAKVEHYHRAVELIASDFQDMGEKVLRNIAKNRKLWVRSFAGEKLKKSYQKIPAIICGASPSLDQEIPLLATLQDRALIFAGGSAVTALTKQGITPHFCLHLDPDPPRGRFLEQDAAEIPHFYQSRFSSELLELVHAPLLWISGGGNDLLEKYLKRVCDIDLPLFDAGWSVANFATATAALLGCDPIIFVGMEFSFSSDQVYAGGLSSQEHGDSFIEVVSQEGKTLMTKKDWLISASWQTQFAKENDQIQFFNATPKGVDLAPVPKISLQEAASQYLRTQFDFSGMIHSRMQKGGKVDLSEEMVDQFFQDLIVSYHKCDEACTELLKLWERAYPHSALELAEYAIALHTLETESAFTELLDPLWQIWKRPILRSSSHPLGNHIQRLLFFKKAIEGHLKVIS